MLIPLGRVSALLVLLLLSRDILINGLRAVAATRNIVIGAGWVGKWKTGAQMTAIPMLMIKVPLLGAPTLLVGQILLWVSLALSLYSGADYLWAFFKDYKEEV
jgi:phosphatidylglycerophosphate synthase